MFRYSTISISFFIILFAFIVQVQYEGNPGWIILIPIIIYLAILAIGSIKISLNFYFPSLCKAKTKEKEIVLTFDDGPNPEITPRLLKILEKEKIPATFFCIGNQVNEHPKIIKEIDKNGHLIGNHSYSHHRWFDLFSSKKMNNEIKKTNDAVRKEVGKNPLLFRPPYGVTNPTLKKALQETNMISIGWSLRSFDTFKPKDKVLQKLKRKTKGGDVVLFHDTDEKILEIIEEYLSWLKENGFKIVSLTKLFEIEAYETE